MDILVFGSGDRARSVMDVIRRAQEHRVVGILSSEVRAGDAVMTVPVLGGIEDLPTVAGQTGIRHGIIAIGDVGARMETAQQIAALVPDFGFVTAADPDATLGSEVRCGAGTVVMAGARIEAATVIGDHGEIGSNASIGAGSHLSSFVSVGAGAAIGDGCHLGSGTAIGLNAALVKGTIIGSHCVVGPGAMVLENVPDLHVAIGVPAKCVRTRLVGEPYL